MSEKLVLETKGLRGEDGYRVVSVRMKETLITRIGDIADKTGHSRNEMFSILLNYAVDNCVIKEK